MSTASTTPAELFNAANTAKTFAYAPYSNFRVGAALRTTSGRIFTGCNVENSSYGLAICAERTALVKAVSEGFREFTDICVTTDLTDKFCSPCGACRQFIVEFGLDITVHLCKPDGSSQITTSGRILPDAFTPADLKLDRVKA
ncbi:cytidine deaminase [Capsaspora owczarzaki ATCC 30864]|uniref:Cytidine deaminase n=1 Tax=Capsaspora owczarzaki (strain ATCC 30864) TaxID=595528 RepID=A0A0D2WS85_CAPO3|nr:cytidine deaminase [Capsaspora owczarzaki ATCC 30864]KJE94965.1 cytidine deaminase [Capsaspora owczarzaki ATCC 30864]|eukprot:XP_004346174.1 cytidine deaminase [Capsaspora owczarzaki ATCC 30864]